MPRILSLLGVCALAAWWPSAADACTCSAAGSACEEFSRVDAVFVGRVISIQTSNESPKFGTRRVQIAVVEALRGVKPGQVVVRTYPADGGSCGYPFTEGETYLVYAFEPEPGMLVATACGRTRIASEVTAEISYLRSLARPAAGTTGRIDGQLQTLVWPPAADTSTDLPPRVRLTATGTSGSFTATSNTRGEFSFGGLPLGRYEVKADTPEHFEGEAKAVDLFHGESCSVTYVTLWHSGRVSGRVMDRDRRPVANLALALARTEAPKGRYADAFLAARTADDGTFEFRRVPPGDFTLRIPKGMAANPSGESDQATVRVSVATGQHVQVPDFTLPSPVATLTIEGVALTPAGKPVAGAAISVRTTGESSPTLPMTTNEDGSFRVTVVAGGDYTIHATRSTFRGKRLVSIESGEAALRTARAPQTLRIVLTPR